MALRPNAGHGLLIFFFLGFLITHNDASQSVGLLWTSDQFVAETSTWQHTTLTTDKHPCPHIGIRTHDLSRLAAADLRLRPRGYWGRQLALVRYTNTDVTPVVWQWTNYTRRPLDNGDRRVGCWWRPSSLRKSWRRLCVCAVLCPSITGKSWPTLNWTMVIFYLQERP